ncbi:MAG: hypothetical protein IT427_03575 [Pirellulales bacterium]|nr:hypothetical protein [Pirellulales bacterium]
MADDSVQRPLADSNKAEPSRVRRWFARLLYLLYLAIILEVGLQLFYFVTVGQWLPMRMSVPMFARNEHCEFFNRANLKLTHNSGEFKTTIYTNGQGLRTSAEAADYPLGKQAGKRRILLLGPSFAFGWGVDYEQSFASLLQAKLFNDPAFGPDVEVLNAGVPCLGPVQELNWYQHEGKKFEPDLVIQFVYGSTVVPSGGEWNSVEVDDNGFLIKKNATTKQRIVGYAKNSALVYYLWQAAIHAESWFDQPQGGAKVEGAGREMPLHGAFNPDSPEVIDSMKFYTDLRATVEQTGAKLLVVYFPLSYCVHEGDRSRWAHLGVVDIERQNQFDADFCQYLQEQGFDCLNLTDNLKAAAAAGERLYYYVDIHWTPAGNEVAARAVAGFLKESSLTTPLRHPAN